MDILKNKKTYIVLIIILFIAVFISIIILLTNSFGEEKTNNIEKFPES